MAGFMNFFIIIPVVYLVGQIDFTEDRNVLILRCTFVAVHLILAALIGILYKKISSKNDTTVVKVYVLTHFIL